MVTMTLLQEHKSGRSYGKSKIANNLFLISSYLSKAKPSVIVWCMKEITTGC